VADTLHIRHASEDTDEDEDDEERSPEEEARDKEEAAALEKAAKEQVNHPPRFRDLYMYKMIAGRLLQILV
jgi:hypothetical protein